MKIDRLNINHLGVSVPGFIGCGIVFDELEAIVGAAIPLEYIEFIRSADGGHPEASCFSVPNGDVGNIVEVDTFYSIANPDLESIKSALADYASILGPKTLPVGRDGGGNQFYILLDSLPSSVWLYVHDENGKRVKLAESFCDFISGLFLNPDFI